MSAYIASLKAQAAAQEQRAEERRAEHNRVARDEARERLTPLQDRLDRLLETIPTELLAQGVSLNSLRSSLRGRSRPTCSSAELGVALRKAGFTRVRNWRGGPNGFPAVWRRMQGQGR